VSCWRPSFTGGIRERHNGDPCCVAYVEELRITRCHRGVVFAGDLDDAAVGE